MELPLPTCQREPLSSIRRASNIIPLQQAKGQEPKEGSQKELRGKYLALSNLEARKSGLSMSRHPLAQDRNHTASKI